MHLTSLPISVTQLALEKAPVEPDEICGVEVGGRMYGKTSTIKEVKEFLDSKVYR